MPTIPSYNRRRVLSEPTSGPLLGRQDPDPLNTRAIGNLIQKVDGINERVEIADAEDKFNSFKKSASDLLHNPDNGYFNTRGQDATYQSEPTMAELKKLRDQIAGEIGSQRGKDAFNRVAEQYLTRTQNSVYSHASKGVKQWEAANRAAIIEDSLEDAIRFRGAENAEDYAAGIATGLDAVRLQADEEGLDAEARNERFQNFRSVYHMRGIESSLADGDTAQASKILEKFSSSIEPQDKLKAQAMIDKQNKINIEANTASTSIALADKLVSQYGSGPGAEARINEAMKGYDPELRKATRAEVKAQIEARNRAEDDAIESIDNKLQTALLNGETTVAQFRSQNPRQWDMLPGDVKRQYEEGSRDKTDKVFLNEMLLLPDDQLKDIRYDEYASVLNNRDAATLTKAIQAARSNKTDNQETRTRSAQTKSMFENYFGKTTKDFSKKQKAQADVLHNIIDDRVRQIEEASGNKMTSGEYTDMLGETLSTYAREKKILGFFTTTQETDLQDIPADELNQVREFLRSSGKALSTENILRTYEKVKQ